MSKFEASGGIDNAMPVYQQANQIDVLDLMRGNAGFSPGYCRQPEWTGNQQENMIDFGQHADPFSLATSNFDNFAYPALDARPGEVLDRGRPEHHIRDESDEMKRVFDTLEKYLTPQQMVSFLEDLVGQMVNQRTDGQSPGGWGGGQGSGGDTGSGKPGRGGDTGSGKTGSGGDTGSGKDGGGQTGGGDTSSGSDGLSPVPSHATLFSNVEQASWRKNGNQAETALPAGADPSSANPKNKITRMDANQGPDGLSLYTEGTNYADSLFAHTLSNNPQDQNANHFRWSFDVTGGKNSDKAQAMEMDFWQARQEGDHHQRYMFGSQITGNKLQLWDEKNQHWITAADLPTLKPGETYHMDYDLVRTDDGRMWYKGITVNGQNIPLQHNIQMSKPTTWSNPSMGIQYQQDLKNGTGWGETINNIHVAAWHDDTVAQQLQKAGLS